MCHFSSRNLESLVDLVVAVGKNHTKESATTPTNQASVFDNPRQSPRFPERHVHLAPHGKRAGLDTALSNFLDHDRAPTKSALR